jgi:3-hydroxy-9,10-secoandrosta-1,3,5(10)-triene-9,17-dione monooxygenase reductase component
VHVLSAAQEELSHTFATRGADKFSGLALERGRGEIPLLKGCSARFQCRTAVKYEGGDHVVFIGEVETFDHFDRPPLVFHGGRYAATVAKPRPAPSSEAGEPDSSFSEDFLIFLAGRAHYQLFLGLKRDLERHGLSEWQWFVLSILGVRDNRSVADLDQILWRTGTHVTHELVAGLAAAGFAELHGGNDPGARVTLTEAGRRVAIELAAAAKAIESHAERNLGFDEAQLLKQALRSIIRETDPGSTAA